MLDIKDNLAGIKTNLDKIGKAIDFITDPKKIAIAIWSGIVDISTPVCVVTTIVCLILYVMGHKKAGKALTLNWVLYITIQALDSL